ncbi:YihY/virulence factor BrkB family protein [Hazenella sp. IB182357]|uniref:YihY/virulence factor BrkB family protein n=1 Tax=Polycladospora coralii TaxID=2771432 RepID=A0A926NCQ1_9BACL|nr:YihY/virulence factor BrkB family protein [Polycladospora coralii]MBD1373827.1 YihY/virulence factor BrkB family protein [Polycladospora coralii]MBS7531970.1 YihY/virulence factor BrkB family protein [Polycladospora coralii]
MMILYFLRELKDRFVGDHLFDSAAQLAYYFLMSLFPFLFVAFTFLGYLPVSSFEILEMVKPYAPANTYELISSNLTVVLDEQRGDILSVGIFVTIYLASAAFQSMIRILNKVYQVKQNRPFWKSMVIGIVLMFGLLLALVISLILPVFGKIIGDFVASFFGLTNWFHAIWSWIRWLLSSLVILAVFILLYKYAPNTKVRMIQAIPGALFTTLGWQLSSLGFSYYVSFNDYTLIYGNLGGLIILVVWFYLSALILIIGGVLNATLCHFDIIIGRRPS